MIVIKNQGEVNINAIELLGATNKDGDKTIGMFGTGLKYAIALAMRKGLKVRIFSGTKTIDFQTKPESIGSATVNRIVMLVNNKPMNTSWTTQLGQIDWADRNNIQGAWMIIREFMSNALDEGSSDIKLTTERPKPEAGFTTVVLENEDSEITKVVRRIDRYFLQLGNVKPLLTCDPYGEIYPLMDPRGVYNKGVYIQSTLRDFMYTYNFHGLQLNESRTVDIHKLHTELGKLISFMPAEMLTEMFTRMSNNHNLMESQLWGYNLSLNKAVCTAAWATAFDGKGVLCSSSMPEINQRLAYKGLTPIIMPMGWFDCLKVYVPTVAKVLGSNFEEGRTEAIPDPLIKKDAEAALKWARYFLATNVCVNLAYYNKDTEQAGYFDEDTMTIGINLKRMNGKEDIYETVLHELGHAVSKATDGAYEFVGTFTRAIVRNHMK